MIADLFAGALALYGLAGALFALWFVVSAVGRFDPAARGSGIAFRVLIFPGVAALWPVLLRKWRHHS